MNELIIAGAAVALAPFYVAAVLATYFGLSKLVEAFTQSATQTRLMEKDEISKQ